MESNLKTYSSKEVISYYEKYNGLQKPEQSVLNILKDKLSTMKMLDIGIGAGRTTKVFAPLVKEYIGIDYSTGMVNACKSNFRDGYKNCVFETVDARDLSRFNKNSFDFVLFSFNGIDYVSYEDRTQILQQIYEVLSPAGYYCFSTHNLKTMESLRAFQFRFNILALLKRMGDVNKIKKINREKLASINSAEYLYLNDGAHDFGLNTCYIRAGAQIEALKKIGFRDIDVFSLSTGEKITDKSRLSEMDDKWLYYFCRK